MSFPGNARPIGTLVLIDDNSVDQKIYRRILERSGQVDEILAFHLAQNALQYLIANRDRLPDLILLDVNMPTMDGFEFLEALRNHFGGIEKLSVVVMLTTSLDTADMKRAATFPVIKDFLNKPLSAEHIGRLVDLVQGTRGQANNSKPDDISQSG